MIRSKGAVTVLVLAFGATAMKFIHLDIERISVCRFKGGVCGEKPQIYLDEQRGLANLLSTGSSGNVSIPFTGEKMTSAQGSVLPK